MGPRCSLEADQAARRGQLDLECRCCVGPNSLSRRLHGTQAESAVMRHLTLRVLSGEISSEWMAEIREEQLVLRERSAR